MKPKAFMRNQLLSQFLNLCFNPYLLLILSVISIIASITDSRPIVEVFVIGLLTMIMILIALRDIRNGHLVVSKRILVLFIILIAISLLLDVGFYLSTQSFELKPVFRTGAMLIRLSIFAYGLRTLARTLAMRQKVTDRTIVTALVGYLFIGIIYSFGYYLFWQSDPKAFHISVVEDYEFQPWNLAMYFSFLTLTTVGYGDIVPVNRWVMALSIFEAITGSAYLTVIIARLVSLFSTTE